MIRLVNRSARMARARAFWIILLSAGCLCLSGNIGAGAAQGGGLSEQARSQAEANLQSPNPQIRLQGLNALTQDRSPRSARAIANALKTETHDGVKETMIQALGDMGDRSVAAQLADIAAKDRDNGVRIQAAWAVYRLGDSAAIDSLEKLALDPKHPAVVRSQALIFIGASKGALALPALKSAVRDPHPDVRQSALDALGRINHPKAIEEIKKAAEDSDAGVRRKAKEILDRQKATKKSRSGGAK